MKINVKEQRERREKENKIIISNSKKEFGKGSFIYDVLKICLKIGPLRSPPYPHTSNFGLTLTYSLTSLIGILYHSRPVISEFFFENLNNEINIVTYSFFLC